jgi:hypothetical protein
LLRKHATLIHASERIAKAQRIVAAQQALIANLKLAKRPPIVLRQSFVLT